jgi:hypothetical protein
MTTYLDKGGEPEIATGDDDMHEYDMSIHTNPDAVAWAKFYAETKAANPQNPEFDSEENMVGWFANAMMAMHDHLTGQSVTVLPDGSAFFTATISTPQPNVDEGDGK